MGDLPKSFEEELVPLDKGINNNFKKSPPKVCEDFEQIMDMVGGEGKFQKILVYGILTPITILCAFLFMNTIFMWDIPDHWCHVPGWNPDTMSLEEWKNFTLPREKGPDGQMRPSQCKMFDQETGNETKCQHGWDYDKTDYSATIPSEYDWVCDRDYYATDCFTWVNIGSAIGTVITGIIADKYGRKPVFFLCCASSLICKTVSLYLAHNYIVYKSIQLLGGFPYPNMFNMVALICIESSGTNYRSWIYAVTWMVWVIGNAGIPFVAQLCRNWFVFGWVASIPAFLFLFYYPILEESPRWLITVGKTDAATKVVMKMARRNGAKVDPGEIREMIEQLVVKQGKELEHQNIGVWTLFSKFRIAKNTIMLIGTWSMNMLLYYGITLNTTKMAGNKFVNYFILALIELPGGWVAGRLAERTGRRWTQTGFLICCSLLFLVCAIAVMYQGSTLVVIIAALGIKFGLSITSMMAYLQGAEIFPTPLRSTGAGLASTVSSVVGILGPYIVYSGLTHVSFPYALLCLCSIIGFMAAVNLPETLNQKLPETVEEANGFGKGHGFWSYLPQNSARLTLNDGDDGDAKEGYMKNGKN